MWLHVSNSNYCISNCILVGLGVQCVSLCATDCQCIWFVSLHVCSVKMWVNSVMYECVHVCMCGAYTGACMVVCLFIACTK